jgi:hypothetical protein
MDWLEVNRDGLRAALNTWFSAQDGAPAALPPTARRPRVGSLPVLQSWLLHFSQLDVALRLKSEFKLFDRIYVQSRHQIRSFPYLPSLRKVRQIAKRLFAIDVGGACADVATTKLAPTSLVTRQSFRSLQWRALAAVELCRELSSVSENLIAHLTQELSVPVFVHFPVAFLSLSASLASLSGDYAKDALLLFSRLRTLDRAAAIDFPEDPAREPPELPWDPSFEVPLDGVAAAAPAAKVAIAKLDFRIEAKPVAQLRGKPPPAAQKPKSSLESLGF